MFFSGSLQEGIALAVQESKAVICFVQGSSSRTPSSCSRGELPYPTLPNHSSYQQMTAKQAQHGRRSILQATRYCPGLRTVYRSPSNNSLFGQEFTRLLEARSVLLRITKESPEAGFLASVCPVSQYPTVVAIKYVSRFRYAIPMQASHINNLQEWNAAGIHRSRCQNRRVSHSSYCGYGG
jgi:hypothetical protein